MEKEFIKKDDVAKHYKGKIIEAGTCLMEECNVMAIGRIKLEGEWIRTKISTDYLEKIIKCLKMISMNKEGLESIDICWTKDHPVMIGRFDKDKMEIAGFILAPRVDNE